MKDILSARGLQTLEQFAASEVMLGFGYEGTLAPLLEHPGRAHMRSSTRMLLAELSQLYPCAVVSGGARRDVLPFVEGVPLARVVGNHGLEMWAPTRTEPRDTLARWHDVVERRCSGISGVRIEDNTWSLAVHYGRARRRAAARAAILTTAALLPEVRVVPGKQVVNLVHSGAPNKGMAVLDVRNQLSCASIIYVGDDLSDDDVFALECPGQLLAIKVGRSAGSRPSWYLRAQGQIDDLLATMIALRPRVAKGGSPSMRPLPLPVPGCKRAKEPRQESRSG
jgi:trehalose 6-phosphate phosphatase